MMIAKELKQRNRGDTIIEVLLATSVLTLVLFASWGLVNRSTQLSLAARQRIVMVNQLKEQAEILKAKYAQAQASKQPLSDFLGLTDFANPSTAQYSESFCTEVETDNGRANAFHFNNSAQIADNSKIVQPGSVVWIEYVPGGGGSYTDFYVRGCWLTIGGNQTTDNSQFIVRLNK